MIMLLKSRINKEAPLFHLVDQSWDKNGYVFQCIPAHKEEARAMIPGLIPIIWHKYRDNVVKSFTPNAVEHMKSSIYDDKTGEVAPPMDAYITEVKEADKELNCEKEEIKEKEGHRNSKMNATHPSPMVL